MASANASATCRCPSGSECAYMSDVMYTVECPSRLLTTTMFCPACSATPAW